MQVHCRERLQFLAECAECAASASDIPTKRIEIPLRIFYPLFCALRRVDLKKSRTASFRIVFTSGKYGEWNETKRKTFRSENVIYA